MRQCASLGRGPSSLLPTFVHFRTRHCRSTMGGSNSRLRDYPLRLPQAEFVGTINKRFVKDRMVTLVLQPQFWSQTRDHDSVIRDGNTGQVLFKVGPITGDEGGRRRLLLDAYGVPVAGMDRQDLPPSGAEYSVVPGGASSTDILCTIATRVNAFETPLRLEFNDPVTNKEVLITTRGRWQIRDALITMTIGQNESVYSIARIYCDGNPADDAYCMDIAPGVDAAMMVLIAGALEEQTKKHVSPSDRVAMASAIKAYEKQQKKNKQKQPSKEQPQAVRAA